MQSHRAGAAEAAAEAAAAAPEAPPAAAINSSDQQVTLTPQSAEHDDADDTQASHEWAPASPVPSEGTHGTVLREEGRDAFDAEGLGISHPPKFLPANEIFFSLTSPVATTLRLQSRCSSSAYASAHVSRARSALQEQIPIVDAATQEVAAWGSTEDEDFVTPWYTYAMRALMPPLSALIAYFIYWRAANYPRSGVWWQDACAWTFIVSEAVSFLFGMTHWVWMWNLKFRKRVTQAQLGLRDEDLPTVDIMIPCYSEPTEIVEMTLKACYDMDYPAYKITIWVCDDGKV
ncbi:hypothetical protein JKP88DRAFT_174122, partial [Tribonema minus]